MTQDDKGINIEKAAADSGGISVQRTEGELPPPLTEEKERAEAAYEAEETAGKRVLGKVPISPAVIKPPLRFEGLALAEITGYPGWMYTEEDLEDIATLIQECGWEADPRIQVLFALVGLHGAKLTGYLAWKRSGRSGDLKKRTETGEQPKTERPGEEVAP